MSIRTIVALVLSPYYGILILFSSVPVLVVAAAVTNILGIVTPKAPLIFGLFVLVLQAAIYGQNARAAASITGLQKLNDQPSFTNSVVRSLSGTFLVMVFAGFAVVGLFKVCQDAGLVGNLAWLDSEKLIPELTAALQAPATDARTASFAGMNSEALFFIALACSMFLVTMISMLVIPRAAGLDDDFRRAYGLGMILMRIVIALPFCGMLTLIVVNMVLSSVEVVLGLVMPQFVISVGLLFVVEIFVFSGMIFIFEAYLLAIGRELGEKQSRKEREIEREDTSEFRALRQSWSRRA